MPWKTNKISALALLLFAFSLLSRAQLVDLKNYDYKVADSVARNFSGFQNDSPAEFAHAMTKDLNTEQEKFRALFIWVCNNIEYKKGRYGKDAENIFKKRVAVCEGYSSLLCELCSAVNIKCVYVSGFSKNDPNEGGRLDYTRNRHAWNAVSLNGNWYLCDVTWASGYLDEKGKFVKAYNDFWYLTNPDLFLLNHYPRNERWKLSGLDIDLNQFSKSAVFYPEVIESMKITEFELPNVKVRRRLKYVFSAQQDIDYVRLIHNKGEFVIAVQKIENAYIIDIEIPDEVKGPLMLKYKGERFVAFMKK